MKDALEKPLTTTKPILPTKKPSEQNTASKAIMEFKKKYPSRHTPRETHGPDFYSDKTWGYFIDYLDT